MIIQPYSETSFTEFVKLNKFTLNNISTLFYKQF